MNNEEAEKKINDFFKKKEELKQEDVKKVKRLAMKFNIKLGEKRKRFCKKCFADLKGGKIRVTKKFKIVECRKCGFKNRWRIK